MGLADLVSPVASSDRDHGELGQDNGAADGGGHLLGALHTQTDVAVRVADGNECLEARTLASPGLLLDGHDLQHLESFKTTHISTKTTVFTFLYCKYRENGHFMVFTPQ